MNSDGVVSLQDASMMAYAFGARPGDARWNPALDVFGEGVIDLQDVSFVYLNYGNDAQNSADRTSEFRRLIFSPIKDPSFVPFEAIGRLMNR